MHICNAPFCNNSRNYNHAWCGEHRWEREKYKVKPYKELLPFWSVKRCPIHGLLRVDQCFKKSTGYICKDCNQKYQSYKCNMGLGYFDDDSKKITQALNYLN